jgi:tRNA(Ile)-lysidine synthase
MIKLALPLPQQCYLAFSGGSDSSMLLHFLTRQPKRFITLLYVIHNDYRHVYEEFAFVKSVARKLGIGLEVRQAENALPNTPKEFHWSNERNRIYRSMGLPVLTAHNLNDALEWFLMTTTKGSLQGKLIPIKNRNILRPLLITRKSEINDYLEYNNIEYYVDPTNKDISIVRNRIRHEVVPAIEFINPGIYHSLVTKYKQGT